jgi:hypothetical protein
MLLQVQWVPRDAGEPEPLESDAVENDHDDAVCLFISNAEKGWILRLRV